MVEIADHIETVARHLLGEPNRALSKPGKKLRFGTQGSIEVDLGKGVWYDYEQGTGGGVLDLLVHRGIAKNRADAIAWLKGNSLEWIEATFRRPEKPFPGTGTASDDHDRTGHQRIAQKIWQEASDPRGTIAERYLKDERNLRLFDELAGAVLRFHPSLWLDKERPSVPGIVAAFRPVGGETPTPLPQAIHRTFLQADGRSLRYPTGKRIKMMLGPVRGCAIQLSPHDSTLGVTEGLETALAVMTAGWRPVWAVGSAGGIEQFPVLPHIKHLTIFADNDASGTGQRAAEICAERWLRAGIRADIYTTREVGTDWADAWAARGQRR